MQPQWVVTPGKQTQIYISIANTDMCDPTSWLGLVTFSNLLNPTPRSPQLKTKFPTSIITHQQMHQIYFLFKLSFNNSH
jgi:hypothetical protein